MKWVKSLILGSNEIIEKRTLQVLLSIFKSESDAKCYISDIDATGKFGNELTQKRNINKEKLQINLQDVIFLFEEDGQIFEFELSVVARNNYLIIIRDGAYVDILGDGELLPASSIGSNKDEDLSAYSEK